MWSSNKRLNFKVSNLSRDIKTFYSRAIETEVARENFSSLTVSLDFLVFVYKEAKPLQSKLTLKSSFEISLLHNFSVPGSKYSIIWHKQLKKRENKKFSIINSRKNIKWENLTFPRCLSTLNCLFTISIISSRLNMYFSFLLQLTYFKFLHLMKWSISMLGDLLKL